jgi:hypothetical protein
MRAYRVGFDVIRQLMAGTTSEADQISAETAIRHGA